MTESNTKGIGIEVSDLFKKLGPNQALNGLTMRFDAGLMHGLIGPEGAGKTTLFRTLIQLLFPEKGKIIFTDAGKEIPFEDIRPAIAYMPQSQSLYADLTIEEHLTFFKRLYGIDDQSYKQKREELLGITRLEKFVSRPAGELSGGMYKKLGLMCALLRSPRVMLLDEPTNGVDPISRREFWELLYSLGDRNILVVVATAYLDEAERCSRVHLIDSGKTIVEGVPREILKNENVPSFDALFIKRDEEKEHA